MLKGLVDSLETNQGMNERVLRWTEGDVELMRQSVAQLEQVLEMARANLRFAEARLSAKSS